MRISRSPIALPPGFTTPALLAKTGVMVGTLHLATAGFQRLSTCCAVSWAQFVDKEKKIVSSQPRWCTVRIALLCNCTLARFETLDETSRRCS